MKKINKKGFSLIELMLVLSVIITIMVVAFIMFSRVETQKNISNDLNTISNIESSIDELYGQSNDYKGLSNQLLVQTGIIPKSQTSSGYVIKSYLGGYIEVDVGRSNGVYDNYNIVISHLNTSGCYGLSRQLYNRFKSEISSLSVNSLSVYIEKYKDYSDDALASYCKSNTKYSNVSIHFKTGASKVY